MSEAAFMSVLEVATVLGVSDDLVYELTTTGEIPCVQLGKRKLIPRRAIDLVIERAIEGFDPDALLIRLADAAGSSSAGSPRSRAADGAPTTTTGSEAVDVGPHSAHDRKAEPRGPAPVVALRR